VTLVWVPAAAGTCESNRVPTVALA